MPTRGDRLENLPEAQLVVGIAWPSLPQTTIDAIAERLGALRQRPCPGEVHHGLFTDEGAYCTTQTGARFPSCSGTGIITDPRYQAAWEMVSQSYSLIGASRFYAGRDVGNWPTCAVVGLLEGVVRELEIGEKIYKRLTVSYNHYPYPFRWPNPDDAEGLSKVLLEWLEKEALNG